MVCHASLCDVLDIFWWLGQEKMKITVTKILNGGLGRSKRVDAGKPVSSSDRVEMPVSDSSDVKDSLVVLDAGCEYIYISISLTGRI